jgi:hypothetical protein
MPHMRGKAGRFLPYRETLKPGIFFKDVGGRHSNPFADS